MFVFNLACLLLITLNLVNTDAKKQVTAIRCVPIPECEVYTKLLQKKPVEQETISFIRSTSCGFAGRAEKVWCAVVEDDPDLKEVDPIKKPPIETDSINPPPKPVTKGTPKVDTEGTTEPSFKTTVSSDSLLPTLKECGAIIGDKITGGTNTSIDEYPWLALLKYRHPETGFIFEGCGGALINKQYVLTAAHCITAIGPPIMVVLGEYDIWNETDCVKLGGGELDCSDDPITVEVENYTIHEQWPVKRGRSFYNDIALIRLAKPIEYTDFIKPICMPPDDYVIPPGLEYVAAGWGLTENGSVSNVKLKVSLPPVPRRDCSRNLRRRISMGQVCAGGVEGKDTCKGDSGGPLMIFDLNRTVWFAVGIVSLGRPTCGLLGAPAIYTFIPTYLDWIRANVKP